MAKDKLYVKKIIPYEPYEVGALEGWLDEMTRKGLILTEIGLGVAYAKFRKGKPGTTRFRVHVLDRRKDHSQSERISFYEESGWSFVSYYGNYTEIYKTEGGEVIELHTDPETQLCAIQRRLREAWLSFGIMVACWIYLIIRDVNRPHISEINSFLSGEWIGLPAILGLFVILGFVTYIVLMHFMLLYAMHQQKKRDRQIRDWTYHTPRRARFRVRMKVGGQILFLLVLLLLIAQILVPTIWY